MEPLEGLADIELAPIPPQRPSPPPVVSSPEKTSDVTPAQSSAPPSSSTRRPSQRWLYYVKLAIALFLPVLLETLDQTVVATAQTRIASSFNSLSAQQWIASSYLLNATVFLPIFGSLADIFGRHHALQLAIALFIVGSAICTGAISFPLLVAGRAISGIGAGGLASLSRIILNDSSDLKQTTAQNVLMMLLFTVGYSCGPVIGGALATVNWRWCFAINLPACLVSMVAAYLFLRNHPNPSAPPAGTTLWTKLRAIDYLGAALFVSGGMLILLGLTWGGQEEWSDPKVIAVFVVGPLLLTALPAWEWYLEYHISRSTEDGVVSLVTRPMIPALLLAEMDVIAGSIVILCTGMLLFGVFYFLPVYFLVVQSYSQVSAGLVLLTFTPGLGIGGIFAQVLIRIFKVAKYGCVLGAVIQPIAAGLLSLAIAQDNKISIVIFTALAGFSCGLTIPSIAIQLRFTHQESQVATVVAFSLFFNTFGGTVGLSQMGAVLNDKARQYIMSQGSEAAIIAEALASLENIFNITSLSPAALALVQSALASGTQWAFLSLLPWVCIAAISTLFLSRKLQYFKA